MTKSPEARKQEFRETLKQNLKKREPRVLGWSNGKSKSYESTWAIANTPPYYQSTRDTFGVGYHPRHGLAGAFVLFVVFCIVIFGKVYRMLLPWLFFQYLSGSE